MAGCYDLEFDILESILGKADVEYSHHAKDWKIGRPKNKYEDWPGVEIGVCKYGWRIWECVATTNEILEFDDLIKRISDKEWLKKYALPKK